MENSSDKINRELSNLQLRNDARRQRSNRKSSSIEREVKKPTEYISTMPTVTSDDYQNPQTMSFGINASPSMKNTETQTDKRERSHRRSQMGKFHSMADVRPQYAYHTYDDDTFTESLTG